MVFSVLPFGHLLFAVVLLPDFFDPHIKGSFLQVKYTENGFNDETCR